MIEYLEHRIDDDPREAYPRTVTADEIILKTGDAVMDAWSEKIAKGEEPDILAGIGEEGRAAVKKIARLQAREKGLPDPDPVEAAPEVVEDDYRDGGS